MTSHRKSFTNESARGDISYTVLFEVAQVT